MSLQVTGLCIANTVDRVSITCVSSDGMCLTNSTQVGHEACVCAATAYRLGVILPRGPCHTAPCVWLTAGFVILTSCHWSLIYLPERGELALGRGFAKRRSVEQRGNHSNVYITVDTDLLPVNSLCLKGS